MIYAEKLRELQMRLAHGALDNQELLADYRALAAEARKGGGGVDAANALLSIAYIIGERITASEDLEPYYIDAVRIFERVGDQTDLHNALDTLAWYLLEQKRTAEAIAIFERVVAAEAEAEGEADTSSLRSLSVAYEKNGETEKALDLRLRSLVVWRQVFIQPRTPDVARFRQARMHTALLYSKLSRLAEAEALFREVFDETREAFGANPDGRWHSSVIDAAIGLARCLFRQNKIETAKELVVGEMPLAENLNWPSAQFARLCYEQALKDLHNGLEPSFESEPGFQMAKGFRSEKQ